MGQIVTALEKRSTRPGIVRYVLNRALTGMGHRVEWWPEMVWLAGSICMIDADRKRGLMRGGADPRRMAYALGW